jgi:hypothetical protein
MTDPNSNDVLDAQAKLIDALTEQALEAAMGGDKGQLERMKPLIEAAHAERERLEVEQLGDAEALRVRKARAIRQATALLNSLLACAHCAVDESRWAVIQSLAPLIDDARRRLARLSSHLELVSSTG